MLMRNVSEKGEATEESSTSIVEVLKKNGDRSYLRIFQGRVVVCSRPEKTVAFFFKEHRVQVKYIQIYHF